MRLQSITLANFRGFADPQTIPLGGDIVVIWGANGTGKTSLLDGLEWALLGSVPRLTAASLRKTEDPVASRYATGAPFASIELREHDAVWTVNRIGGESSKSRLTVAGPDGRIREGDEADHFVRELIGHEDLSLRTYLLEQHAMTELLSGDTRERYRFLADLTGLEEVRRFDEQLQSELRKLRSGVRSRQDDLEAERQHVVAAEREVDETRALVERQRAQRRERFLAAARPLAEWLGSAAHEPDDVEARARLAITESERLLGALTAAQERLAKETSRSEQGQDLRTAIDDVTRELRSIETRQSEVASEIERRQLAIAEQRRRLDDLQQLAQLALKHLGPPCPVCGQDHSIDATRARLRAVLDASDDSAILSDRVACLEAEYADLRHKRRDAETQLESLHNRLVIVERDRAALDESRSTLQNAREALQELLRLDLPRGAEAQAASERITEIERGLVVLGNARQDLQQLEALEARAAALQDDFVARTSRFEAAQQEVEELITREARAEAVCRWVGAQAASISSEIMDRAAPLADALFRRFDVHPTFRRFAFRPDRIRETGHLRPWVFDDAGAQDGNAVQVLSAAQLNALAVSLFLALNLEERARLEIALLDDPVQNMDDLNVLSLIDVVRALRSRRQVVITTHDVVLAQLLQSKLRPLAHNQRTVLVKLSQWTPRGPAIDIETRSWEPGSVAYELVTSGNGSNGFEGP